MRFLRRYLRWIVLALVAFGLTIVAPQAFPWVKGSLSSLVFSITAPGAHGAGHSGAQGAGHAVALAGGHVGAGAEGHHAAHKIVVTVPIQKQVTTARQYVCQVHSCRHIEVRAINSGYLNEIAVKEGQSIKEGELMFKILPILYKARYESEVAEAQLAQIEYDNTQKLLRDNVVSKQALALAAAKLARAIAKRELAKAEMNFTEIRAPFEGIVDRLHEQKGSLVSDGDILTTLSDNSILWVYFNVPESEYLKYKADPHRDEIQIELELANGKKFEHPGHIGAIEADFNNDTGNIAFRADFPNPEGLLRHGQTGQIIMRRVQPDSLVIPQRATYEILAKKYVYVVDDAGIVHQREIEIQNELDDIYVVKHGLSAGEKIILEGVLQVRDGDKIEFELKNPDEVLGNLKYKAE
jgi:membrane fusion protein (multidrug efflux system)